MAELCFCRYGRLAAPEPERVRLTTKGRRGLRNFHGDGHGDRSSRQEEKERRTAPGLALDTYVATMSAHDVLHNRQPEACAAQLARAGLVNAVKALEQARQVLSRDANARIGDTEFHPALHLPR